MSARALPDDLGGGSVKFYDTRQGDLTHVVNADEVEGARWVLVVFPDRWAVQVRTKQGALGELKRAKEGKPKDERFAEYLAKRGRKGKVGKRKRATKKASTKKKGSTTKKTTGRVRTRACEDDGKKSGKADDKEGGKSGEKDDGYEWKKEIDDETPFDSAMDRAFGVVRTLEEIEKLLDATKPCYNREGDKIGDEPVWATRKDGVKMLLEYQQGRPREREKEKREPKRMSWDELKQTLQTTPEAVELLEEMLEEAKASQKQGSGK